MPTKPFVCRVCGSIELLPILSLGNLPLANALLTREQLNEPELKFPLDVVLCPQCSLVQITETVPPTMLFSTYPYFSSFSDMMLQHARKIVEQLIDQMNLSSESLVIELASNDGYLLQYFVLQGVPVLGIEPAKNIAQVAEAKGITTISEFFDDALARKLCADGVAADVIIANNVLAHVALLHEFVEGVKVLLKPNGLAVFESAYIKATVDEGQFDQIYHEHLCYYSLTSLSHLFNRHGLEVVDVEVIWIHGGSIRIYVRHLGYASCSERFSNLLEEERVWGIAQLEPYKRLANEVSTKRDALLALLTDLKRYGKRVAGYGASAKGAVLFNAFGIGTDLIEYVVDRSPHKQGLFMPGVHLPIYSPEHLLKDMPDYTLMLAWNFKDEVLEQMRDYRLAGGKFIIPIPNLEIV